MLTKMVNLNSIFLNMKSFARECFRVLKVTKKPTNEEFKTIVKVSGAGMILIGLIGFLLQMVNYFITFG